jgi:hypothetical protein
MLKKKKYGVKTNDQRSVKLQPGLRLFLEGELDFHIRENINFPNPPRQEE